MRPCAAFCCPPLRERRGSCGDAAAINQSNHQRYLQYGYTTFEFNRGGDRPQLHRDGGLREQSVPDETIAVAKAAVQRAEQSGAPQAAPVELAPHATSSHSPRRRMRSTTRSPRLTWRTKPRWTRKWRRRWLRKSAQRRPRLNSTPACRRCGRNQTAIRQPTNKDIHEY